MKYSQRFLPLKVYLATSMFLGQPGICQFTSPNFRIILNRLLWCLHGGNTIPRSHPGKIFENFSFYPVSQAVPTGVLRQGFLIAQIWKLPKENTQCFHCLFIRENEQRCMKIWCSFHEPRIHCKVWNLISFGLNPQEHNKTDFS